jgi:hypothetical protein
MAENSVGRPAMPAGYGIKGPQEGRGLLPWSHVESRMQSARNYWLVTSTADGIPHAAPVWGLWHDGAFYFSTDPKSRKGLDLSSGRPVVVHLESGDEAVILEGQPAGVRDGELLKRLDELYFKKYEFHLDVGASYRVEPLKAFAWSETDFPTSATRWIFPRRGSLGGDTRGGLVEECT